MASTTIRTTPAEPFVHHLPPPFAPPTAGPLDLQVQGAESLLYKTTLLAPGIPCALKYRPAKAYRHPTLDRRLTKARLLAEARVLVRCRRDGVLVPGLLAADWESGWIAVEWIEGRTVREVLDAAYHAERREPAADGNGDARETKLLALMRKVGMAVGQLHAVGVCHGDLTTSNLMLRPPKRRAKDISPEEPAGSAQELDGDVVLIDFGLAQQSVQEEDKAVDLYVLERAFGSTHPQAEHLFQEVLRAYGEHYKAGKMVLKKLDQVRMRGRKKSMLG